MTKPFNELTVLESIQAAKEAVTPCRTVREIRQGLNAAGFNGDAGEISRPPDFTALVKVAGPRGNIIYIPII